MPWEKLVTNDQVRGSYHQPNNMLSWYAGMVSPRKEFEWVAVAFSSEKLGANQFQYICSSEQEAKDKVDQMLIENGWAIMSEKAALLL